MRKITTIVIHHTAVTQPNMDILIASVDQNHKERLHPTPNGFGNHIAYHYIIGVDGETRNTRPLEEVGYHASNLTVNQESVGVSLSGNFDVDSPTTAQYKAAFDLIEKLKKQFGPLSIKGHNEYANKTCPGLHFSFYQLFTSLMLFYEKLRKDNYEKLDKNKRMFKDPEAFIERIKDLSIDDKFGELTYLIAVLAEKLGNKKLT